MSKVFVTYLVQQVLCFCKNAISSTCQAKRHLFSVFPRNEEARATLNELRINAILLVVSSSISNQFSHHNSLSTEVSLRYILSYILLGFLVQPFRWHLNIGCPAYSISPPDARSRHSLLSMTSAHCNKRTARTGCKILFCKQRIGTYLRRIALHSFFRQLVIWVRGLP